MLSESDARQLLDAPIGDLTARAARRRDRAHGSRITFSPKVFIPLTMLCRDRCGYCTFAKPPARLDTAFLGLDEVLAIARRGAAMGCSEALFTLGEAPEARYPAAREWLSAHGYASTLEYLVAACAAVLDETGLLPHANAGALDEPALTELRAVSPSQGMMIETLAARLGEPGHEHAGLLESELAAAVAGGVTSLVCPPDTDPVLDEPGLVEMLKFRARNLDLARLYPLGALTRGLKGEALSEMAELTEAGCVGFAQADVAIRDTLVLHRALQYAATFGYSVWLRPNDAWLGNGVAAKGPLATRLGLTGVPVLAETIALATIFELMRDTGAKVHLCR
ncbi:MAG TPA: hypothetical protein VF441_01645, partial [Acidimicrobiia bacterium]